MSKVRLGVCLESLGLPLRRALQEAQRLGVAGVQVEASGDLAPDMLSQTGRREFRHLLRAHDVELTALGCPLRRGLDAAENQDRRIDHVKKVLSLSFDLGPRIAIVSAGQIPVDDKDPRAGGLLTEALRALGQHGDRVGATLALETGLDAGTTTRRFLDTFDSGSLAVNFDPANLVLNGHDPYEFARVMQGRIAHASARDARRSGGSRIVQEVPLGHGDIDWMLLLGVLEEIEYRGWLTVTRDTGNQRAADVAAGVAFLRHLVG
jgi:sugar phosphate isomerase/epimerase